MANFYAEGARISGRSGTGAQLILNINTTDLNNYITRVTVDIYLQVKYNINEFAPRNGLNWSWGGQGSGNEINLSLKFGITSGPGWNTTLSRQHIKTIITDYSRGNADYSQSISCNLGPLFELTSPPGLTPTVVGHFTIPKIPVTKPSLSNIRNNNPYLDSDYYCASGTSISIAFDRSTGNATPDSIWWGWSMDNINSNVGNVSSFNIDSLEPGTEYTVYLRAHNGWGGGDIMSIKLSTIEAPELSSITNTNKYKGSNIVSASETTISASCTLKSANEATRWAWKIDNYNSGAWNYIENDGPFVVSNASGGVSGRSRIITFRAYNPAGWGKEVSLSIRQRWDIPDLQLTHTHSSQSGLNDVTISWKCTDNKTIASIYFKLSTSAGYSVTHNVNATLGTFTIANLNPSTTYSIQSYITTNTTYDGLNSTVQNISARTDDISVIPDPISFIFGTPAPVTIYNDSGNRTDLEFYTSDGTLISQLNDVSTDSIETFTQTELDKMYRKYTDKNNINIYILVLTHGNVNGARVYTSRKDGIITLTGIAKTAWYNDEIDPKRGMAWFNHEGTIRRGVLWFNDNGTIKRAT